MSTKIIIFGAFITGKKAFEMMKSQYDIIAFSDNCSDYYGKKLFDIPVIPPEEIPTSQAELVVIASMNYYMEIAQQLIAMGIDNLKLFRTKVGTRNYILLDVDGEKPFKNCIYRKIESNRSYRKKVNLKESNIKGRKKVLIIAYYFPPAGSSPIQRTLKFVKYMREYGYEPIVLTTESDSFVNTYPMDQSLLSDIPEGIQIIRIKDDFAWSNVISQKKSQEIIEFLYSVSDSKEWMDMFMRIRETQPLYIIPDKLVLWANECVRHIEQYIDMSDIDVLYSTVPEWSPHLIALFLKEKYGIKWVADYRDPWVSNIDYVKLYYPWMTKEEIILDQNLERKIVQKMDKVIVAGGKWAVDFVKNYNIEFDRIREITNGYDEEDFCDLIINKEKNKKFTLCYNGGIGYNRNPIPLIRVLNSLIERNELNQADVQWIFNGPITSHYLDKIDKEDRYHIVVRNGILEHKESLQIAINSNVMVMYGEPGAKGVLNYPGKFYEYLRIGKPILCFSSDQSFQADVLREIGLGINLNLSDFEEIIKFLRKQIAAWTKGENIEMSSKKNIWKYERKNLTQKLINEFNYLVAE